MKKNQDKMEKKQVEMQSKQHNVLKRILPNIDEPSEIIPEHDK